MQQYRLRCNKRMIVVPSFFNSSFNSGVEHRSNIIDFNAYCAFTLFLYDIMEECCVEYALGLFLLGATTDRSDDVKKDIVASLYFLLAVVDVGILIKVPFISGIRSSGGQNRVQDSTGKQKQTLSVE